MYKIILQNEIQHTKVFCPFGNIKDLEGRCFDMNDQNEISATNEYGTYKVDIDKRDIELAMPLSQWEKTVNHISTFKG